MSRRQISFPPGLMGESPKRYDVVFEGDGVLAISKLAGDIFEADAFENSTSNIISSLRARADSKNLEDLGMETPYAVNSIDKEISGLCLIALNKASASKFRELMGSGAFEFEYSILAKYWRRSEGEEGSIEISLPMLRHSQKPRAVVSHRFGKQARTSFEICAVSPSKHACRILAKTVYPRPHQIRLHAAEAGIEILGENLYTDTPSPTLRQLSPRNVGIKNEELFDKPVYPRIALHLGKISFTENGKRTEICAAEPKGFIHLAKKLSLAK